MYLADNVLHGYLDAFHAQKNLADRAIAQIADADLRRPLDENTNSIAVIMKHVSGNLISRFTEFLTTDGEKPWRDRDAEFTDTFRDRSEIIAYWEGGWNTLFDTFASLRPEHLDWQVFIRGDPFYVPGALARSLAHTSYHCGQIVLTSRLMAKDKWEVITIPRGQSKKFNLQMGYGDSEGESQQQ